MKNYIILILLGILFIGCSSSQKSLSNSNSDKRKILFISNLVYVDHPKAKKLVNEFINDFKKNLVSSQFEAMDFLYLEKNDVYPRYNSNSVNFKNGYLGYYYSVYDNDKLLKYKPDDIIVLMFDFEYGGQWNTPRKIKKLNLYVFNSSTRKMNKISVGKSFFSNLSNKVIDNLSESNIFSNPKYNNKEILIKKLSEISKDLKAVYTKNEYGSSRRFEENINEINAIKNRIDNIETLTKNSELQVELYNLNNKLTNKIFDTYVSYSENQIDKKEAIIKYRELLQKYERKLTKEQLQIINNKLRNIYDTNPSISIEIQGWSKLNNSNLRQFSSLLAETVQNIWYQKDTIKFSFQYKNTRPVSLIIEYYSKKFPFSYINIDSYNYSIIDLIGMKLLLNLLDNFVLYGNYVPELTYDLDKFLANLIIYYNDSKFRSVRLFCFAYGNSYDGLNIKVSEVGYRQKSWSTYKLIKSNSNLSSTISFTTFEKEFLNFLLFR